MRTRVILHCIRMFTAFKVLPHVARHASCRAVLLAWSVTEVARCRPRRTSGVSFLYLVCILDVSLGGEGARSGKKLLKRASQTRSTSLAVPLRPSCGTRCRSSDTLRAELKQTPLYENIRRVSRDGADLIASSARSSRDLSARVPGRVVLQTKLETHVFKFATGDLPARRVRRGVGVTPRRREARLGIPNHCGFGSLAKSLPDTLALRESQRETSRAKRSRRRFVG